MMARLSASIAVPGAALGGTQFCHLCIATNCSTLASCGKVVVVGESSSGGSV